MRVDIQTVSAKNQEKASALRVVPVRSEKLKDTEDVSKGISADHKKRMFRKMLVLRHFEKTAHDGFLNSNVPGPCHVYIGEEATAVGVCEALQLEDYIVSTHRGHGHCLAKGARPDRLLAELYGKVDGYCQGRGGSMHIFSKELGIIGTNGIVGGGLPLALGAGMHAKLKKSGQVCACFFGDGAANQGTFHESLNLAAVQKLPVIFVCENNLYATATKVEEATLTRDFAERAAAYRIPGFVVDGNNVLEVYQKATVAVARARANQGPTLLECKTYRHSGHYVGEDSSGYRPRVELEAWLEKDPIEMFRRILSDEDILDVDGMNVLESEVIEQIKEAHQFALNSPFPDPKDVLNNVFVD